MRAGKSRLSAGGSDREKGSEARAKERASEAWGLAGTPPRRWVVGFCEEKSGR
jgi:hypothetical protein